MPSSWRALAMACCLPPIGAQPSGWTASGITGSWGLSKRLAPNRCCSHASCRSRNPSTTRRAAVEVQIRASQGRTGAAVNWPSPHCTGRLQRVCTTPTREKAPSPQGIRFQAHSSKPGPGNAMAPVAAAAEPQSANGAITVCAIRL